MTPVQVLRRIVLPQAVTRMLPPIGSQFISLFKESALVSLITLPGAHVAGPVARRRSPCARWRS